MHVIGSMLLCDSIARLTQIFFHLTVRTNTTFEPVAYAQNFHGGGFIQWYMVVISNWCVVFVTSPFDVIFMFPNQCFGEIC